VSWVVLEDPEGNEFCLIAKGFLRPMRSTRSAIAYFVALGEKNRNFARPSMRQSARPLGSCCERWVVLEAVLLSILT